MAGPRSHGVVASTLLTLVTPLPLFQSRSFILMVTQTMAAMSTTITRNSSMLILTIQAPEDLAYGCISLKLTDLGIVPQ